MRRGEVWRTNSEYIDVAFDGAFVGRENVDCEFRVEACNCAGCDGSVRHGRGGGDAEESEGGGEECEFHREK